MKQMSLMQKVYFYTFIRFYFFTIYFFIIFYNAYLEMLTLKTYLENYAKSKREKQKRMKRVTIF